MMLRMTSFDCGDVILVPFPFTDQTKRKQRPAIIVSTNAYNTERPDLIIMAVTAGQGSGSRVWSNIPTFR